MSNFRVIAATDQGIILDLAPSNVGIYRLGLGVEYSPEDYQSLSTRVSYRTDQWSDKNDGRNNGRVNIVEAGVSAKF
jgi:hypothetical protein